MSDLITTFTGPGLEASVDEWGHEKRRRRRSPAKRPERNGDTFAAAASQLTSTRTGWYGQSGYAPNSTHDKTRIQRQLIGGPGDRHISFLDHWIEREISRQIYGQSELIEGVVETYIGEVVQCGFHVKPTSESDELNAITKEYLFGHDGDGGWCDDCESSERLHFWELVLASERREVVDGDDALYLNAEGNDGLGSIHHIEGDRIVQPLDHTPDDGVLCINGVEIEVSTGRAIRAFIAHEAPQHSGQMRLSDGDWYETYDKKRPELGGLLFNVDPKRPTSTRRLPWMSTSVRGHDELTDVLTATRIQMRNQACRSTYTQVEDWNAYKAFLDLVEYDMPDPESYDTTSPAPGDHTVLNPGEKAGVLESNTPSDNFKDFAILNLRFTGMPLQMCLSEVAGIFETSFSADRLAIEKTRRGYRRRRKRVKRRKSDRCLQFGIARAIAQGELPAPDVTTVRLTTRFPAWPYMEPQKDAQANKILRELETKSSHEIVEERGEEYDDVRAEIDSEPPLPVHAIKAASAVNGRGPGPTPAADDADEPNETDDE